MLKLFFHIKERDRSSATYFSAQFIFILALSLFISACVPESSNSNKSKSKAGTTSPTGTGTNNTSTTTPSFGSDYLYWFSSDKITGAMTVNKSSENIVYLRGKYVHDFLSLTNAQGAFYNAKQFCLVANFTPTANYKQLRVKATPLTITNYTTKKIERLLRIDLPASDENTSACAKKSSDTALSATFANGVGNVCVDPNAASCKTTITAQSLELYESKPQIGSDTKISSGLLNLSTAGLKIDLLSKSSTDNLSCTNANCGAKGFDCCLDGQCVKDGAIRPNLDTNSSSYKSAMADFATNPLSFLNYPNVFFICTNVDHTLPSTGGGSGGDPTGDAVKRVEAYKAKWKCMNNFDLIGDYSLCSPATEAGYLSIKKEVAKLCSCSASDADIFDVCPNWRFKPVYKSNVEIDANIVDFTCITPAPAKPIGDIVNLNTSVTGRTAPHRLFYLNEYKGSAGTTRKTYAYDSKKQSQSDFIYKQEGDDFSYIDENLKTGPSTTAYNINSVVGPINIELTRAQSAKMINVEIGKTYIVAATGGFFTPCTKCKKDSWIDAFMPHPGSANGTGLKFSGHTTKRDEYAGNSTLGNYEDTIFGRACWLPVTMLPFSHAKKSTSGYPTADPTQQRQDRLKTQAALYINGYQRDWFGFNKGALIGSFDGVQWFAIGGGRRLTASTNKLFLAINAAFSDLADATDTLVKIVPDNGGNIAADYDFDPELAINDPKQNTGATCQKFHQCETDSDCVTQLGWEYSCADVTQVKTKWPVFSNDAEELGNTESENYLINILSSNQSSNVSKRCVYRGMGALCKRDFGSISNSSLKKYLTCAPNFTCVSLSASKFNQELIRSPNEFDNILFGRDANVLGRPKDYVTSNKALPTEAIDNLTSNANASLASGDYGLCMPGKAITAVALSAHQSQDASKRTDFISQIASCPSTATGVSRVQTCPLFDSDMNYVFSTTAAEATANINALINQNSCGGDARDNVSGVSAFQSIELATLAINKNIPSAAFAADACFRRAGSVCHTDLDCSPNKMHADLLGSIGLKFFGNTRAEYKYWEESLICGQVDSPPSFGSSNYFDYDLKQNRCCREIGKDFTMFTMDNTTPLSASDYSNRGKITPDLGTENLRLNTQIMTYADPKANYRYSRYQVSKTALADLTTVPTVKDNTAPAKNQWKVVNETGSATCCGGGWIRKFSDGTHDWTKVNRLKISPDNFQCINFRSFLSFPELGNPSSRYYTTTGLNYTSYSREYDYFCRAPRTEASVLDGGAGITYGANTFGCLQGAIADLETGFDIKPPYLYRPKNLSDADPWNSKLTALASTSYARMNVIPSPEFITNPTTIDDWTYRTNEAPYQPRPVATKDIPMLRRNFFFTNYLDPTVGVQQHVVAAGYLPFYVPYFSTDTNDGSGIPSIKRVQILLKYRTDATKDYKDTEVHNGGRVLHLNDADCTKLHNRVTATSSVYNFANLKADIATYTTPSATALADGTYPRTDNIYGAWCVQKEATTGRPILYVMATLDFGENASAGSYYDYSVGGYAIDFLPHEGAGNRMHAGNQNYYLTKLAALELLGVPQITYEPIYCTNRDPYPLAAEGANLNRVIPGIYDSSLTTKNDFAALSGSAPFDTTDYYGTRKNADTYGNSTGARVYQNKISLQKVFTGNEFTCCTPLGKTPSSSDRCCSGYAAEVDGVKVCKIPKGTDLNVYFNKFISGEGIGESLPLGGFLDEDFVPETGEIKMQETSYNKIAAIGAMFCDGEITKGGAFGYFPGEPFANAYDQDDPQFPLSIVDSDIDFEKGDDSVGRSVFDQGFRWNHHLYCK